MSPVHLKSSSLDEESSQYISLKNEDTTCLKLKHERSCSGELVQQEKLDNITLKAPRGSMIQSKSILPPAVVRKAFNPQRGAFPGSSFKVKDSFQNKINASSLEGWTDSD